MQIPAHAEGEKLPAVILAHGSGASDRDGPSDGQLAMTFGFTILKFVEIGQALEDAGFVVLRFDKRSCGPFNGCADNGYEPTYLTIDTLIQDVEGGLAFLAEQPEVDGERLFFIGHSLGASYVPVVMRDHPEVRAGVMLAGGFHPIDHSLDFQADKLAEVLRATGEPGYVVASTVEPIRTAAADLRALRDGTFEGTTILGGSVDLWASWLRLDDEAPVAAAALDRPMLILSGDYDWNIPPEETEAWAEYLGPDTIHQTKIVPCVSHALNCISNPDWLRLTQRDFGRHVDEQVIDEVLDFLLEHR